MIRMKVLIAEDEPVAAKILQRSLESMGYEVRVASSGDEAWELFDREPVRLIVSDWMMPGLNGLGLCEKIRDRKNTPYTYFILLTSQETGSDNYDLASHAGVDDFLTKPLDRATIKMRLRVAQRIQRFTTEIHQLKEYISICANCRKIRAEDNYWQTVEKYINEQTGSHFSHGICPGCAETYMAELDQLVCEKSRPMLTVGKV